MARTIVNKGRLCSVCELPAHARWLCRKHYQQRYGRYTVKMKLRNTWAQMVARCHDPAAVSYPRYGARGIEVCDAWRSDFRRFARDVGDPPTMKHQIDRIDNDGDYETGNVRWVTPAENSRIRRSSKLTLADVIAIREGARSRLQADLAREYGVCSSHISRVVSGEHWRD